MPTISRFATHPVRAEGPPMVVLQCAHEYLWSTWSTRCAGRILQERIQVLRAGSERKYYCPQHAVEHFEQEREKNE